MDIGAAAEHAESPWARRQPSKHCYRACKTAIKALLQPTERTILSRNRLRYRANQGLTGRVVLLQSWLAESSCYRADCKSTPALALLQSHPHWPLQSMRMRCVQRHENCYSAFMRCYVFETWKLLQSICVVCLCLDASVVLVSLVNLYLVDAHCWIKRISCAS